MLLETLKQDFSLYKNQAEQGSFLALREQAFAEFESLGFPTTKHEEWKYTSLKSITEKTFSATCEIGTHLKPIIDNLAVSAIEANRLVFVNGSFVAELSSIIETDSTIVIGSLASERHNNKAVFEKHFGKYADVKGVALNALNTALLSDGAFVYVPAGKTPTFPIVIIHLADASAINVLAQPRNLIVVEANSSVVLIENYSSTGSNASFTNVVSEIYAGENAHVEHYKIQQQAGETYHNNYTQIFQEANTNINHVTLTLDGTWVRNNLHFYMNGQNCNSLLYGLYIPDGRQHVDNHTRVDHASPNCFSDEKYKGVLKDHSTAVFNGKIHVHIDAQKTNAYQRNQNVLLSNDATINTKPQLEIFADDVKCTHGATIGQLDEESMFYLRSRGIPENTARKILLNAFADDIAEKIKIPELVQIMEQEIERKI
jgi:Fe-S cluster assembly protein SufD